MNNTERLYQKVAQDIRTQIISGQYQIGDKLPAERLLCESLGLSRTVVREAMIMLEVEGFVEVRKGSGIHVMAKQVQYQNHLSSQNDAGPFELLQARQLIESNIAEFAATQVTKNEITALYDIQEQALQEDRFRDSKWDKAFHIEIAKATQNGSLVLIVENMWQMREQSASWKKLHEHIDARSIESWCEDHDKILQALIRKDSEASKLAMWQHLENTKQMLFKASSGDFETFDDRYLFAENPVIHLREACKTPSPV